MDDLDGRVAVITGAASGIGTGMAEAFGAEGMKVFLADIHPERLDAVADELRGSGLEVGSLVTDVGDGSAVEALAEAATAFGDVGVVCNNVGVLKRGTAWEIDDDEWYRIFRNNVMGTVHGAQSFVPRMIESGRPGHIVNTASMAAVIPPKYLATYNATKHAVLGFSETLDLELREAGHPIGVTVLMPGPVRTRLGTPWDVPVDEYAVDRSGPPREGQLDPADIGRLVVDAVKTGRRFLLTHPARVQEVRDRFDRILSE